MLLVGVLMLELLGVTLATVLLVPISLEVLLMLNGLLVRVLVGSLDAEMVELLGWPPMLRMLVNDTGAAVGKTMSGMR